jgi:hypothetical protein
MEELTAKGRRLTGEAILKRFNEETAEYREVHQRPVVAAPLFGPLVEESVETPEDVYHEHLIKLALVTSTLAMLEKQQIMSLPIHEVKHFMTAEPESEGASNPNRNLTYLKTRVRSRKFKQEGDKELTSPTNVDGGASITVVDENYAKYINADIVRAQTPVRIRAVNGGVTLCRHECRLFLDFEGLDLEGTPAINTMEVTCVVMPGCSTPILMGSNTMAWYHVSTDLSARVTTMGRPPEDRPIRIDHMDIVEVERAISLPIERMDAAARVVMAWSAEREEEALTESHLKQAQAVFAKEVRVLVQLATEDEPTGDNGAEAVASVYEPANVGSRIEFPSKRKVSIADIVESLGCQLQS